VRAALEAGIRTFGENRVQEAAEKRPDVDGGSWHMVGRLQSNKAARAVELFDVIESVDSADLARRLSRVAHDVNDGKPLPIYLQVNVDRDPHKTGFDPESIEAALPSILDLGELQVEGLMTVGRLVDRAEEARPTFRALRELRHRLVGRYPQIGRGLSMGMSDDFEVAVEEGATLVRIGRALFGGRR
jgi:pyridoxal phosphate enzyme (YggS family)